MGKVGKLIGGIFFFIGLVFLAIGAGLFISDQQFANDAARTTGSIIEINRYNDSEGKTMYRPLVSFRDETGKEHQFTGSVSSSSPTFSIGEQVEVIYDRDAPAEAIIDTFLQRFFLPLVFGGMGSIFALIGGCFLFIIWRRKQTVAELKENGTRIQAKVLGCARDTSIRMNGRSPFRVSAQAVNPKTGKLASFRSDPIWVDLSDMLDGKEVPVLIDPQDVDDHYIDLSQWVDESERA
ncbi:MAG: DUF3592 domain-containing protein [Pseudomonadota bacterium]